MFGNIFFLSHNFVYQMTSKKHQKINIEDEYLPWLHLDCVPQVDNTGTFKRHMPIWVGTCLSVQTGLEGGQQNFPRKCIKYYPSDLCKFVSAFTVQVLSCFHVLIKYRPPVNNYCAFTKGSHQHHALYVCVFLVNLLFKNVRFASQCTIKLADLICTEIS